MAFVKDTLPMIASTEVLGIVSSGFSRHRLEASMDHMIGVFALYGGVLIAQLYTVPAWLAAGSSQIFIQAFSWNTALYFSLRSFARYLKRENVSFYLRPEFVFGVHCVHNDLLVHRAEWVDPTYIKLWLRTIVGYPSLDSWLKHFNSRSCSETFYSDDQVCETRFQVVPKKILGSMTTQLPFVTILYLIPYVLKPKILMQRFGFKMILGIVAKVMRTSLVLALLPYCLTEFPCVYGEIQRRVSGKSDLKIKRARALHVVITSLFSTIVFMLEPKGRLDIMVVYTYWRILEAWIRKIVGNENIFLSPILTGLAVFFQQNK